MRITAITALIDDKELRRLIAFHLLSKFVETSPSGLYIVSDDSHLLS